MDQFKKEVRQKQDSTDRLQISQADIDVVVAKAVAAALEQTKKQHNAASPSKNSKGKQTQLERLRFGGNELIVYPPSPRTFKAMSHVALSKEHKCIIDNLWLAFNKKEKDKHYFIACLNALSEFFHDTRFKFYVVARGNIPGVFDSWLEVCESIKDFKNPLYKGFNSLSEAYDTARSHLGAEYYVSPSLRQMPTGPLDYSAMLCTHCEETKTTLQNMEKHICEVEREKRELFSKLAEYERKLIIANSSINNPQTQAQNLLYKGKEVSQGSYLESVLVTPDQFKRKGTERGLSPKRHRTHDFRHG